MAEVQVNIRDNGPLRITGKVLVMDAQGNQFEAEETVVLCRCGQSGNKPFCDGTHRTVGFESAPRAAHPEA